MQELHAGYVSAAVWDRVIREELNPGLDWKKGILRSLSSFVIDRELTQCGQLAPELAVLDNLLSRGLPTLPSLFVERTLANRTRLMRLEADEKPPRRDTIRYGFTRPFEELKNDLERALCILAPGAVVGASPGFRLPDFGSAAEEDFMRGPLAMHLGAAEQCVERQRNFQTIDPHERFHGQAVDFAVEFPGKTSKLRKGQVFEVDGSEHKAKEQAALDRARDKACEASGWAKTFRWRVSRPRQEISSDLTSHPYYRYLVQNDERPLSETPGDREILELALAPFAVARIQKVLLEAIRSDILSLSASAWHLCIVERDVPCGRLAIDDFWRWISRIFALYCPGRSMPEAHVEIARPDAPAATASALTAASEKQFDLLLDVSVLQRYGVTTPDAETLWELPARERVSIRSGYRCGTRRPFRFAPRVKPAATGLEEERLLSFFLRNVFRMRKFREKQIDIIRRALRGLPSVALLPTGAGKSLTYQLPGLLQTGSVIVIDPLRALMKDQVDNLRALGIDSAGFINSTMTPAERKRVGRDMAEGLFKFVFVSPERLLIGEFRRQLAYMNERKAFFCLAVVDEAHCVSEWGHDFRTAYLRLAESLRQHCPCDEGRIPLLALTGTASYEVLADVQRELSLPADEAVIIRLERMAREELRFKVCPVECESTRDKVAGAKRELLPRVLNEIAGEFGKSLPELIDPSQESPGAGLVFCPHATGGHGVSEVKEKLQEKFKEVSAHIAQYSGKDVDTEAEKVQEDFKTGRVTMLTCTNAFGMGIDKANIRFTVHFSMPKSMESFYQEAGRAGRDRANAYCYLLYAGSSETDTSVDRQILESFHANSYRGKEHEYRMIDDLLNAIRLPPPTNREALELELDNLVAGEITVGFWENYGHRHLYLNKKDGEEKLGYIDLDGMTCHAGPHPDAEQVLGIALKRLGVACLQGSSVKAWLEARREPEVEPGIEERIDGMAPGETCEIAIPFENCHFAEMADRLRATQEGWTDQIVLAAYDYAYKSEEYVANLTRDYEKEVGGRARMTADTSDFIREVFPSIRNENNTFRAVHRLAILGVVRDYTVDYRTQRISATIARGEEGEHTDLLKEYMGRYLSREEARRVPQEVDAIDEETELRRCAKRLIAFVYDKIVRKRNQALEVMDQTAKAGVSDPEGFREQLYSYFDSRFTTELRAFLYDYDESTVFDTIGKVGGTEHDARHLLGSCDRLLIERDDNAAFHGLKAYAMALLGRDQREIVREIRRSLRFFRRTKRWTSVASR